MTTYSAGKRRYPVESTFNALVDTGSPITIVSLDCLLDVLVKLRTPNQTLEEWKQGVKDRFQTASLSVKNYDGGEVNIVGQITCLIEGRR